ncbi:MAG: cation:proton antiporter, partial [Actinobacteria bacterium]|nr:cation:proton antiporter [Actinomycetota bacterium]NIS29318.1 cation:proton antiporter [Actinomycetota bacterium]NIT94458.1 cation:proton antiporter [Actinomycetota bacterium]NIU21329.1 cation:proton antiporter [Actinomycetota bacterium]NIU69451.1 cation:proton antiporter [Actinomycetota bacterium]
MLTPLDEHELLVFWTQLLVLVATARLCGSLMRRINLPSVIGQLGAGVILGPSVFGRVWERGFDWFLPDEEISSGALFAVTWLGVALLLVTAGFETDLGLIRRLGRAAALVTGFSLVVPLVGGLVVGELLPESFIGAESDRTVFALFVAAALSVSALAVIAKILSELGLMRRDFGQITVAAGMANDVVGWVMLAVFTGFAASGEVSVSAVLETVLGLAAFLFLAMTVGQRVVDRALRWVRREGANVAGAMSVVVFTMLVYGVATQALGIEAVLGAFVAGVVLHRSRFQQPDVLHHIESLTTTFLAPVFFATAGLRVDLGLLGEGDALAWAGVVIAVAIVAKFAGAYVGARMAGQSPRAATALGAGLNARGAL